MPTLELLLNESTYTALKQKARQGNQSIEEVAQVALTTFLTTPEQKPIEAESDSIDSAGALRRAKIHAEAEAWRAMPETDRHRYRDEFVAVHDGQVIDYDPDRVVLYHRIRDKLGDVPVLITPGGVPHPREFKILSPRPGERV